MNLHEKYKTLLNRYEINTPLRIAHAMTQLEHENPNNKAESLYYKTIQSLRKTFYTPFKNKSDAFVSQYLKNTEKCANYVYANRMGNGSEKSGEGFKYRARGFGITGKENYFRLQIDTDIQFLKNPDLLLEEANMVLSMCWYWKKLNLNKYADRDDLDAISDLINIGRLTEREGDANGYDKRKELLLKWKKELSI